LLLSGNLQNNDNVKAATSSFEVDPNSNECNFLKNLFHAIERYNLNDFRKACLLFFNSINIDHDDVKSHNAMGIGKITHFLLFHIHKELFTADVDLA